MRESEGERALVTHETAPPCAGHTQLGGTSARRGSRSSGVVGGWVEREELWGFEVYAGKAQQFELASLNPIDGATVSVSRVPPSTDMT